MRYPLRKFLACMLLALYGGVSLLGHGLHLLTRHAGPHRGLKVVECATHHAPAACDCAFHHRLAKSAPVEPMESHNNPVITSADCATALVECGICKFLVQARSAQPRVAGVIFWHEVVADASLAIRAFDVQRACLGPQAPRGPPLGLA